MVSFATEESCMDCKANSNTAEKFRKPFSFRKGSDEGRLSRFQRSSSPYQSLSPSPSPSETPTASQQDHRSSLSSLAPSSTLSHSRSLSDSSGHNNRPDHGALGLNVLYTPENEHKADIVFIHGLGGTSRKTWSMNENPDLFWPLKFLPLEPDLRVARILTFGYDANFLKGGKMSMSVLDFAKDLLFDLRYAKDDEGAAMRIGKVCFWNLTVRR